MTYLINFFPKHNNTPWLNYYKQISEYEDWLYEFASVKDYSWVLTTTKYASINRTTGINIFDPEIAVMFKLKFEL